MSAVTRLGPGGYPVAAPAQAATEITGSLSVTEAGDSLSSVANVLVSASLAKTEAGDSLSSAAKILISAALAKTEAGDSLSASAKALINASLSVTEEYDLLVGAIGDLIVGALSETEYDDLLSATGLVSAFPIPKPGHLICASIGIAPLAGTLGIENISGAFEIIPVLDGQPAMEECG